MISMPFDGIITVFAVVTLFLGKKYPSLRKFILLNLLFLVSRLASIGFHIWIITSQYVYRAQFALSLIQSGFSLAISMEIIRINTDMCGFCDYIQKFYYDYINERCYPDLSMDSIMDQNQKPYSNIIDQDQSQKPDSNSNLDIQVYTVETELICTDNNTMSIFALFNKRRGYTIPTTLMLENLMVKTKTIREKENTWTDALVCAQHKNCPHSNNMPHDKGCSYKDHRFERIWNDPAMIIYPNVEIKVQGNDKNTMHIEICADNCVYQSINLEKEDNMKFPIIKTVLEKKKNGSLCAIVSIEAKVKYCGKRKKGIYAKVVTTSKQSVNLLEHMFNPLLHEDLPYKGFIPDLTTISSRPGTLEPFRSKPSDRFARLNQGIKFGRSGSTFMKWKSY
jgi:hypothetical protein